MKPRAARTAGLALVVLASFTLAWRRSASPPAASAFRVSLSAPGAELGATAPEIRFASSGKVVSVHSATAVEISGGRILALWYGGSREGAKDVALYSAVFDPEEGSWSDESIATTREATASDLSRYVKKLGNPVLAKDPRGRLWLFYVSVSVGGWSGSSVNFRISEDEGRSWSPARRLVSSPFLNLSTLVRGPALAFDDDTIGLPVYHELLGKFGEILRLSSDGKVLWKTRLSHGRSSLQPVIVPWTPKDAVALLRRSGSSPPRILVTETADGGQSWTPLSPSELPNPDAAVSALRLSDGRLLVAFNDSETDRSRLTLAESRNRGRSFQRRFELEPPEPTDGAELRDFAYPWLLQAENGDLHLLYTWNRRRITHVWFRRENGT